MSKFKKDEIGGMNTQQGIVCSECMADQDWAGLSQEMIITLAEIEMSDELYFCDECDEQLK